MVSGILYKDLSDHLPVFQITHLKMVYNPPPRKKQIRLINLTNLNSIRSGLANTDWSFLHDLNTTNDSYDPFSNHLIPIYNQSFPIIAINSATSHSSKPWFSNGLLGSCKRKNSLYKQYILNPTSLNKSRYHTYRNKYNFLIKVARKKFFHDKLISINTNLRKTWSVI